MTSEPGNEQAKVQKKKPRVASTPRPRKVPTTETGREMALLRYARQIRNRLVNLGVTETEGGNSLTVANIAREERRDFMQRLAVELKKQQQASQRQEKQKIVLAERKRHAAKPLQSRAEVKDKRRRRREERARMADVRAKVRSSVELGSIAEDMLSQGRPSEVVSLLRPVCAGKNPSPAIRLTLAQAHLKLHAYDSAMRVIEPVLEDPMHGRQASAIAALALLEQDRPFLARTILRGQSAGTLGAIVELSAALHADEPADAARALAHLDPALLFKEKGMWRYGKKDEVVHKLAPGSFAKSVTLAEAQLANRRPDLAVSQVFNALGNITQFQKRDVRLYVRALETKARSYLGLADEVASHREGSLRQSFGAVNEALGLRPGNKPLLQLAADIVQLSGDPAQQARLKELAEYSPTLSRVVKDSAPEDNVAELVSDTIAEQEQAKIERRPHRPTPNYRRAVYRAS